MDNQTTMPGPLPVSGAESGGMNKQIAIAVAAAMLVLAAAAGAAWWWFSQAEAPAPEAAAPVSQDDKSLGSAIYTQVAEEPENVNPFDADDYTNPFSI